MLFELPEPSGEIVYKPDLRNSCGGVGCWYVGNNEFEVPDEDVVFFAQMLADAIAVRDYVADLAARSAREAFINPVDDPVLRVPAWEEISGEARDAWRRVVGAVVRELKRVETTGH